ncbi:YbaB/EbfC family nucleoid-associated protein [Tessaracoccus sp. MC1865]|uniref:YbaB/EbfC family nucleoid-associated protein n=1 Tax=Tessaracoccus sp. MC1865 TaxID=2760310 RepID=UPI00160217AD|nr:YbaB/EbfC family nucleoid-associated protein [Tessaracoccus sp. MC1865]MBB1484086.1 YbaB/EbfC family nucleoid-associated protein [Tessaracoccus sp. MC1865]QTO37119.1 YbaB/EbfC family nucleoid-associated protein [Tessaracoccus sp. MC1865]
MFGDFDINALMQQAQKLQTDLQAAQEELGNQSFTGTAGGGLVSVTLSGKGDMQEVEIQPAAVDPDDIETLQALVVAAFRSARAEVDAATAATLPELPTMPGMPGFGG